MQKVGIITLQYPYNYGSALQAYALQKTVDLMGANSTVINYICDYDFENYRLFRWRQYFKRPKTLLADVLYFSRNVRRRHSFRDFDAKNMKLTSKKYHSGQSLAELNREFETFICGSDQIWNFKCTGGVDPAYFLDFVSSDHKRVAYAPSLGQADQSQQDMESIRPLLSHFDFLSIREKSMQPLVERLSGRNVEVVLDPTLLLEAKDYTPLIAEGVQEPYIFVYLLEPSDELVDYTQRLAMKKGLKVVYISNITKKSLFKGLDAQSIYGASPDEFLSMLKNARYVVTNSFHATVFSIIFHRHFVTFKTKKSFPRMLDLLDNLGLSNRIAKTGFEIDNNIDFDAAESKLRQLRKTSIEYLREALAK